MRTHKYLAHFIIEADTPLAVGSGERGFNVDRLIARDALGLPYIPGSSLAGVLRHNLDPTDRCEKVKKLFGYQRKEEGQGSRINFSSAHLIGEDGHTAVEGLQCIDLNSGYYNYFQKLPERDHVRINDRGAADAEGHGKFDEELVHKGTRFAFSIELSGEETDEQAWRNVLDIVHQPLFRIGAGTRKGFGKLKVISCRTKIFDLTNSNDLLDYLAIGNSLNENLTSWQQASTTVFKHPHWDLYQVKLSPDNFFLFGAGYGDKDVDNKPKTEQYFEWKSGKPKLREKDVLLIPATSVKGALSHRIAYHYNLLNKTYIGDMSEAPSSPPDLDISKIVASFKFPSLSVLEELSSDDLLWEQIQQQIERVSLENELTNSTVWQQWEDELDKFQASRKKTIYPIGENNPAVKALFGYALNNDIGGARGNVIFSDIYLDNDKYTEKIFSHVSIDRFTGGARDGMLFQQKVSGSDSFVLDIYIRKGVFEDITIKTAFENALNDLCNGNLQLGGSTTKGHGVFNGSFEILTDQP